MEDLRLGFSTPDPVPPVDRDVRDADHRLLKRPADRTFDRANYFSNSLSGRPDARRMNKRKPATGRSLLDIGAACVELVALAGPNARLLARVLLATFTLRECDQVVLAAVAAATARKTRAKPCSRIPLELRQPK